MLLCNDKYYSAPRLGTLQELTYIEESVPGIPGMTLLSRMPLALSTRWGAGARSELGSAVLVGILCCLEASLYSATWDSLQDWVSLKIEIFFFTRREGCTEHLGPVTVYFIIPLWPKCSLSWNWKVIACNHGAGSFLCLALFSKQYLWTCFLITWCFLMWNLSPKLVDMIWSQTNHHTELSF